MSTRSNIGILNPDNTVDYIYCHFDGYLDHNGRILNEHYTSEEKVRELMALGDLSYLGIYIGEQQNFNDPISNWCLAYGRDRGESNTEARTVPYKEYSVAFLEEYVYLFVPGEGWKWRQDGRIGWSVLSESLELIKD